jgi:hypothetical protein
MLSMPVLAKDIPANDDKYLFWVDAGSPSSIAASFKKDGIRLAFKRVEAKYVVVDKIAKLPTAN